MPLSPAHLAMLDQIARRLTPECRVLFITGAGMSADSGLPTYRGIGGLYNAADTEEGVPIEEALSGQMLRERPAVCWKYLAQIGRAAVAATFNRGHEVIAEMERHFRHLCVLTQNIDGYHRAAGSHNVIEIHGNLHTLLCMRCQYRAGLSDAAALALPPRCPECSAVLRPDVVLFGEALPAEQVARLYEELESGFDAVLSVGTTSVFPYIAEPVALAHELGWLSVEINPEPTRVSGLVDYRLPLRAAEALGALWERCRR